MEQVKPPYSFGYDFVDEHGNQQERVEVSDGAGTVRGSYGYLDTNGIGRRVNYVADHLGFRASVSSNEPGVKAGNSAAVLFSTPEHQS